MLTPSAKPPSELLEKRPSPTVARDRYAFAAQIILVIATVAAFWPVCTNDFTTWDDTINVSENPRLNPVTLAGVSYYWEHPFLGLYIPITYTVWGGLAAMARVSPDASGVTLSPSDFHWANLLVHLAAVLVAFQILRLLTRRYWAAGMGALLFALHPLQVEPVAWVAGLKDVLCGFLSLVALWQYLLFAQPRDVQAPPRSNRMRAIHYSLATLALILAMLSKPSAMTVPLAAALLDRLFLRRPWTKIARALIPWLILALACGIVARIVQTVATVPDGGRVWARPLLAGAALAFYLYKLVWPASLAVVYHYSPDVLLKGHWVWFAWMVPFALAITLWVYRKRWPWLLGGAALALIATLPVLGFAPFEFEVHSLVADHYFYFAMIGPALALSFALASTRNAGIAVTVCALVLLALGIRTNLQTSYWHDTQTLFTHNLAVNPESAAAYNSLGVQAMLHNDPPRAEQLARESIRLRPDQFDAYVTLGTALNAQDKTREALDVLQSAYHRNPNSPGLLNNLAGLLAAQSKGDPRKLADAEALCRRSVEINPFSAQAHNTLAMILSDEGHYDQALREAQISVHYNAANPHSLTRLADLLGKNHQTVAAIDYAERALKLDPNYVPARQLLDNLSSRQAEEIRGWKGFTVPPQ